MTGIELGRRYERLLFFTAPISIASLFMLFFALASTNQSSRTQARCYQSAAKVIASDLPKLLEDWKTSQSTKQYREAINTYTAILSIDWTVDYVKDDSNYNDQCYQSISKLIYSSKSTPPDKLLDSLTNESSKLLHAPISYVGVELPDTTELPVLGTTIKIAISTFVTGLQIIIGPILLLWLASLYNTRHRETLAISGAIDMSDVFPHITNLYPIAYSTHSGTALNLLAKHKPLAAALIYGVFRIALLLFFIGPPVASYLYGLSLMVNEHDSTSIALTLICTAAVLIFTITNIFAEILPWHNLKTFSFPNSTPQEQENVAE